MGSKTSAIADGSILPGVTPGNTMAACIIIGKRAAEALRNKDIVSVAQLRTSGWFVCKGLERLTDADSLFTKMLDDIKSHDGIPYWLLPLRPVYLRFFQFALKGTGELRGRRVYIIDFKPARASSPKLPPDDPYYGASAWSGTVWIDEEEAQPVRIDGTGLNPPRGVFSHTFFQIEYQRVSKDAWFGVSYCNVLGGDVGDKGWAQVSFESSDFRKMDVFSQIAYISSTIRYR